MALRSVLRQPEMSDNCEVRSRSRVGLLVVLFFLVGLGLRVTNLDLKTAWMDELSTVIFSLGNSSHFLPTDNIVDLAALLRPITVNAAATPLDSARYLLQENNHPPAYFMLAHLWMDLFSTPGTTPSLAISRLFSALLGSLSIPAIFWAAKNTFQSPLAGILSAALMAVSPFSLFLCQEARHYGLAITLITLSLGYFVIAVRSVLAQKSLNGWLCIGWVLVNILAFANHYFSALTFAAEGMVLAAIALSQAQQWGVGSLAKPPWRSIYGVALGTTLGVLPWLPVLLNFYGSPQTTFLREYDSLLQWLNPLAQTLAVFMTSFVTPANFFAQTWLQVAFIVVTILLALLFTVALGVVLWRGGKKLEKTPQGRLGLRVMGGFLAAMLFIFAVICYGHGSDITRGLRYMFTYYPAVLILAGGILAVYWRSRSSQGPMSLTLPGWRQRLSGQRLVQLVWLAGFASSLLVVNNFAFPKYYAPDRFIPFIQQHSTHPILLVSTEKIFEEPTVIGAKFLSIGWEIERHFPPTDAASGWQIPPQFLVLRQGYGVEQPIAAAFAAGIEPLTAPTDVWVIRPEIDERDPLITAKPATCALDPLTPQGNKAGYLYIHFQCGGT
ncbi:MAG TPA: hypothetical protein V6D02_10355 [Candidatus Obscuribacterales bacterium]